MPAELGDKSVLFHENLSYFCHAITVIEAKIFISEMVIIRA